MDNSSSGKENNTWIKPDMPLCGARMCKEKDENIIIEIKKKLHKVDNSSMVGQQWDKTRSCSWSPPGRRHDGQRKPLRSTTRAQMRERRAAQFSNCFLTSNCQNIQTQSFLEQSVPQKWLQRGLRLEIYSVLYIAHLYIVRTRWNFEMYFVCRISGKQLLSFVLKNKTKHLTVSNK